MFAVDRIENNIVILEDINSKEIREIDINEFNFKIKEKDILNYDGTKYLLNNNAKEERIRMLREKMNKLRE